MIIETRNLTLRRANSPLLIFPDIALSAGQSLLLLGPSGSGKTTLLSLLAGLITPDSGSVFLNEENFSVLPPRKRDSVRGQNFGFIFQTLHLLPSLTVCKNILLAGQMADKDIDHSRADELLAGLGLSAKAHSKPHELSQGERQRVAIARAVFNRPPIIIADEPTSALDDANATMTMDLITAQARQTGASLIVATHDHRIAGYFESVLSLEPNIAKAA